jgi:predicted NAD/FAD-binding protein
MQRNATLSDKPLDIAVIGSGISGMSAAWLLSQKHNLTVFEKNDRIGGHTNTVEVIQNGTVTPIDTGFIVYNEANYPNFVELLKYLDVKTQASDMSFAVSLNQGKFEFGSSNTNSFFGQRSNIFNFDFWTMLTDINKFFNEAKKLNFNGTKDSTLTLGEFLTQGHYGRTFIEKFILPMGAAIWSSKPDDIRNQPATTFIKFFSSHGLLQFKNPIQWQTVIGGSREYIKKLTAKYSQHIKINKKVKSIIRKDGRIRIIDALEDEYFFDHVVIATHADEALGMLTDAEKKETEILGSFKYNNSRVILHSDQSLMPKRKKVWSSWNFLGNTADGVSVTYWMNLLQSIDNKDQYFVSVNPKSEPEPNLLHKSFQYQHPYFNIRAWAAQKNLWHLQGNKNTWFCGSYFGYGFHEDALQAGLAVAEELGGIQRPWKIKANSGRIYRFSGSERVASD